jgi:hypothetical protein
MVLAITLSSCGLAPDVPPAPDPPVIEFAGVPKEVQLGRTITYVLADGGTLEVDPAGYREIGQHGWDGELVVLGWDAEGPFVAGYMRQGGLPGDCYVENDMGIDRGVSIQIRGVLWPKSSRFDPAEPVPPNTTYPSGTRFCFDTAGEIASTVAP